jgi:hypothetical protein
MTAPVQTLTFMRIVTSSLFLCLLIGCAGSVSQPFTAWQFDLHNDVRDQTSGKVWLLVNGKRHLITENPVGGYRIVAPSEYERMRIPSDAVSACASWRAGAGEDMYVRVEPDRILVFRRGYGETDIGIPSYSLLLTIPVLRTAKKALQPTATAPATPQNSRLHPKF